MKIFITGATGFLGYHIARLCQTKGFELLCLRRSTSSTPFEPVQERSISWVCSDAEGWEESVMNFRPDVLIHCAWGGVSASDRNNPHTQSKNVRLSKEIFKLYPYKQIIVLGSQEEYGSIDSVVDELHPLAPKTEYAKAKIETCNLLQEYAKKSKLEWQWIRVFTVFGEKQKETWLIPSMIRKCRDPKELEMETTKGEQIYSYLYAEDFANAIVSVIGAKGKSGIYNVSSSTPTMLKNLFETIKQKTNSKIVFKPTLPYRDFQSMMVMGNSTKFKMAFGEFERTTLSQGLDNIIEQ